MSEEVPLQRQVALRWWGLFIAGAFMLAIMPSLLAHYRSMQTEGGFFPLSVLLQPSEQPAPKPLSVTPSKTDPFFRSIIKDASARYGVEAELIQAIIMAESSYNPRAVSKRGAQGLMQLMPSTAKALGVEDSFNPEHNIHGGVRYFKYLLDRFEGDVKMALAAYNAGSSRVREYQGIPPFKATQYYIDRVFSYYNLYKKANSA